MMSQCNALDTVTLQQQSQSLHIALLQHSLSITKHTVRITATPERNVFFDLTEINRDFGFFDRDRSIFFTLEVTFFICFS